MLKNDEVIYHNIRNTNKETLFPDNTDKVWILSVVSKGTPLIVNVFKSLDTAFDFITTEFKVNLQWYPYEIRPLAYYSYDKTRKTVFIVDCWVVK